MIISQAPIVANIREAECIGCMKCVKACPFDAIVGAPKLMHTVLTDACTGCELCVEPCPVDCIDMLPSAEKEQLTSVELEEREEIARQRFERHTARLEKQAMARQMKTVEAEKNKVMAERKAFIAEAIARAKLKKKEGS